MGLRLLYNIRQRGFVTVQERRGSRILTHEI